jgi:hypothetical protein
MSEILDEKIEAEKNSIKDQIFGGSCETCRQEMMKVVTSCQNCQAGQSRQSGRKSI